MKTKTFLFELLVDGVPYEVRTTPFQFNDDIRYRVSYNGGPIFIFVWDQQIKQHTAIGDGSGSIPDNLELAISKKLGSLSVDKITA
jgi:hypothetical protein